MRLKLVLGLLPAIAISAFSQDFPKAEIFGGYSYANYQVLSQRSGLDGWNASATVNIYKWFGLTADFGGLYGGSATESNTLHFAGPAVTQTVHETLDSHTFMFGPQVSFRRSRLTPFTHFLIGKVRSGDTLSVAFSSCTSTCLAAASSSHAASAAVMAVGGGVDYRITHNLAWRTQADYLQLGVANNVRVSTGI